MYDIHTRYIPIQLLHLSDIVNSVLVFYIIHLVQHLSSVTISLLLQKDYRKVPSKGKKNNACTFKKSDNIEENLPDRIVNPDMYQPLLPATNYSSGGEENSQSECRLQTSVNSLVAYGSM